MKKNTILMTILGVVIIGVIVQFALVRIDLIDTPQKAAVDFLNKYYKLDTAMSERLCEESRTENDVDVVAQYIEKMSEQAQARGFGFNYMKFRLFHIETFFEKVDAKNAKVAVKARKDRAPRAAFPFVARIFGLSKVEEVEHVLELKKENKIWRVCNFEFTS
jgi:hypothetical protein